MKHPMYNDLDKKLTMPLVKDLKDSDKLNLDLIKLARLMGLNKLPQNEVSDVLTRALIFNRIPKDGHVLINIKSKDWESDITRNTFKKLCLKDIKLPFNSGAINIDNKVFYFCKETKEDMIERTKHNDIFKLAKKEEDIVDTFNISYLDKDNFISRFITLADNDTLINDALDEEAIKIITLVMSALMYISAFKNDVTRVSSKKIIGKKSAAKQIKKHTINKIVLSQVTKEISVEDNSGTGWTSDKRWIVRGHWRNQYYKSTDSTKPKWIDPYWKGSGKEEAEKVYIPENKKSA